MILDAIHRSQWRRGWYIRKTHVQIKRLKKAAKHEEANLLQHEMSHELQLWHLHIQVLISRKLIIKAERLGVPLPKDEGVWQETEDDSSIYLTKEGQHELRKIIRQEAEDSMRNRMLFVKEVVIPVGSFIIAVLSLLITYAALKLKH
jgi:hypothetical protein